MKRQRAKIRKDLLQYKIPITDKKTGKDLYIWGKGTWLYRWIGNQFEIQFGRKWYLAESIDFDYI